MSPNPTTLFATLVALSLNACGTTTHDTGASTAATNAGVGDPGGGATLSYRGTALPMRRSAS
jgi:hypothetical protein